MEWDSYGHEDQIEVARFPDKDHTAKKHHTCWECGGAIEPGMRYRVSKYVIDGEFQTAKQHLDKGAGWGAKAKAEANEQASLEEYQRALEAHYASGEAKKDECQSRSENG
jgi:hypothetical protein